MVFYSKVVVEWPFRENGAERERIYTASFKVGVCHLKCVINVTLQVEMGGEQ